MHLPRFRPLLPAALGLLLTAAPARAAVRLPRLVGSHMVLQRDLKLPLWGWAAPGEAVSVSFRGVKVQTKAGADGRWKLTLPAQKAGGPFVLEVQGRNTLRLTDVLVGDVWLASGQSNMEWPLRAAAGGAAEIAAANFPQIRLFNVTNRAAVQPQPELAEGDWKACTPATVAEFSAVAYFFGRDLHRQYKVPVGLISAEWGGTVAEAWTSAEALQKLPDFREQVTALVTSPGSMADKQATYATQLAAWENAPGGATFGRLPGQPAWTSPSLPTASWKTLPVPGNWEGQSPELRDFDGVVWLRREVELPATAAGQPLTLSLGPIDDADSTFFNGQLVGTTSGYDRPRRYTVPAGLVKAGRNVLLVRVLDTSGGGGLWGQPADLTATSGSLSVPLAGAWQYRPASDPATRPHNPFPNGEPNTPTVLYNGMIAPLAPFALKGVIWYQGESNAGRDAQYRTLFPALIADWRSRWQQPTLPFVFVQLAGYMHDSAEPADTEWARLREAQRFTSTTLPNTGMAVTLDLGNPDDIHPRNKLDVGHRLALAARRVAYHETTVVGSGPTFEGLTASGNRLTLRFGNVGGGLVLKPIAGAQEAADANTSSFAVAGPDGRFVWARAEVQGSTVVLHADAVPNPVAVRYAWGNSRPATLYNKAGLPAPPFQATHQPARK